MVNILCFKKPVNCIFNLDSFIITEGKSVKSQYGFGIVVADILQGGDLALESGFVG